MKLTVCEYIDIVQSGGSKKQIDDAKNNPKKKK